MKKRINLAIECLTVLSIIIITFITAKAYTVGMNLGPMTSRVTFSVFIVLALLFFLSFKGRHVWGNSIRLVYPIIATISGLIFYLFGGSVLLAIILLATSSFGIALPSSVAVVIFVLSLTLGILGFIQSRFICIVSYSIVAENFPASWNGKRAVLLSDTHFGLMNAGNFANIIVEKILTLHPDFVLHAGDLYDGPALDTAPITIALAKLTANVPVFYTPGNHESYGDYEGFLNSARAANVTVLTDSFTVYEGVQIGGITFRRRSQEEEARHALNALGTRNDTPLILINHAPTFHEDVHYIGTNLMVSGHTHRGQFWPLVYLVRIIYGIFHYGCRTYNHMTAITTSGVGTAGPPLRLFNPPELVIITFRTK